jgi:nucleoside-diphosphate-sugar epimerase
MILVTGGAGVMGSRLVRRLVAENHRVRALVLGGDPLAGRLAGCGCEIVEGDITVPESLAGCMRGVDTVYHLAAVIVAHDPAVFRNVNVEGTATVVRAAAEEGARHLIYVSSASVVYKHSTHYSRSKMDAEAIVRSESRIAHTIVRPTLVYDRRGGQEIELFAKYIRLSPVVPIVGSGSAIKRPVYAGDIVDGLSKIHGNVRTFGGTYNLSGAEALTMMELAHLLARQMHVKRIMLPVPEGICRAALRALQAVVRLPALGAQIMSGFVEDADLDPADAMRDFGYDPLPARWGIARYFRR